MKLRKNTCLYKVRIHDRVHIIFVFIQYVCMSTHSFFSVMSFEFFWYLRGKKGIKKTHTRCSHVQQFLHNISLRLDDHESSNEIKKKL